MTEHAQAIHFEEPLRIDSHRIGSSQGNVLAFYELEATLDPPMRSDHVGDALEVALPKGSRTPLVGYTYDCEGSELLEEAGYVDKIFIRHSRITNAPDDTRDPALQHLRELSWPIAVILGGTSVTYAWK